MSPQTRNRYKWFGVVITRPLGRIDLKIPPKNWGPKHEAVMRKVEEAMVEFFKLKSGK